MAFCAFLFFFSVPSSSLNTTSRFACLSGERPIAQIFVLPLTPPYRFLNPLSFIISSFLLCLSITLLLWNTYYSSEYATSLTSHSFEVVPIQFLPLFLFFFYRAVGELDENKMEGVWALELQLSHILFFSAILLLPLLIESINGVINYECVYLLSFSSCLTPFSSVYFVLLKMCDGVGVNMSCF